MGLGWTYRLASGFALLGIGFAIGSLVESLHRGASLGDDDGELSLDFPGSRSDAASGVAIQPDGKLIAGGTRSNGSSNDFSLARYDADRTLNASFSGDGMQLVDVGRPKDSEELGDIAGRNPWRPERRYAS